MRFCFALVSASALISCSSSVPHPRYTAQPSSALVLVSYPAPPAQVEFVPEPSPPARGAVWVNGQWLWQGLRWKWTPGVWVLPPEGASYAAWAMVRGHDGQLFFAPGTWRDKEGREVVAPTPLKTAREHAGVIVNAEGEPEPTGENIVPDGGS